jgi:hypothetical protein
MADLETKDILDGAPLIESKEHTLPPDFLDDGWEQVGCAESMYFDTVNCSDAKPFLTEVVLALREKERDDAVVVRFIDDVWLEIKLTLAGGDTETFSDADAFFARLDQVQIPPMDKLKLFIDYTRKKMEALVYDLISVTAVMNL